MIMWVILFCFTERLQVEKQKAKEDVRDAEQIKQKEVGRLGV